MTDAVAVVQRQVDAYNAHDVDAFLSTYAADATVVRGDGQTLAAGHAAMRTHYERLFAENPDVHAEVATRLSNGNWIVDHEQLDGTAGRAEALVAYQVEDGLIRRVVMLGPPQPFASSRQVETH